MADSHKDIKQPQPSNTQSESKSAPVPLSKNKQSYIDNTDYDTYQLTAEDAKAIASHLNKKHNIKIIFNGESDAAKQVVNKNIKPIQSIINLYQGNSLSAARYLQEFFLKKGSEPWNLSDPFAIWCRSYSISYEVYKEVETAVSKFINDGDYSIRRNLSPSELEELNSIAKSLSCAPIINQKIEQYIQKLENDILDCCITRSQAITEARAIQASLAADEVVGYFYTNYHKMKKDHFEGLIITKNSIIKPISWGVSYNKTLYDDKFFDIPHPEAVRAQATERECGTLTLLYLKELLKENHRQLNDLCLQFSYYLPKRMELDITLSHGFIPSPQVLRYSQSGTFNDCIKGMIAEPGEFKVGTKNINATSIEKLLTDSMKIAKELKDDATYQQNKKILDQLPEFRKAWLAEYENAAAKRKQMNDTAGFNRYLVYRARKFEKIGKDKPKSIPENEKAGMPSLGVSTLWKDQKQVHTVQNPVQRTPLSEETRMEIKKLLDIYESSINALHIEKKNAINHLVGLIDSNKSSDQSKSYTDCVDETIRLFPNAISGSDLNKVRDLFEKIKGLDAAKEVKQQLKG